MEQPERAGRPVCEVEKFGSLERAVGDFVTLLTTCTGPLLGRQKGVFKDRHVLEWARDLIGTSDSGPSALRRTQVRNVVSVEADRSCIGQDIARNHGEERCLACPIGANDAQRVALLQLEGNTFSDDYLTKLFRDVFQLKQRHKATVRRWWARVYR